MIPNIAVLGWQLLKTERKNQHIIELVVSTHLKNIGQNGFIFPKFRDENSNNV